MTFSKPLFLLLGLFLLSVSGCGSAPEPAGGTKPSPKAAVPRPHYKVGSPYKVDGVWYHPEEDYAYDEIGLASWYGPGFHGRLTANGERYDQYAMTAAHKTLPLPSYVRVTNLENDAQIVVRLNDRGPFKEGRIIDLSRRAAERLGIVQAGLAPVRVTLLENESRRIAALLRAGKPVPDAIRESEPGATTLVARAQSGTGAGSVPATVAAERRALGLDNHRPAGLAHGTTGGAAGTQRYYVQAGSFRDVRNAYRLHRKLVPLGPTDICHSRAGDTLFYRVVVGPFDSLAQAQSALVGTRAAGGQEARLVAEAESPFALTRGETGEDGR